MIYSLPQENGYVILGFDRVARIAYWFFVALGKVANFYFQGKV
jgi:hypothetical protein